MPWQLLPGRIKRKKVIEEKEGKVGGGNKEAKIHMQKRSYSVKPTNVTNDYWPGA